MSPKHLDFWRTHLKLHPDQSFAHIILEGLAHGFNTGFKWSSAALHVRRSNLSSALSQESIISDYISKELQAGRISSVGPVTEADRLGIHTSPLGVIPKKGQPNKWRLILDLSSPPGYSVNDGIDKEMCSLHYSSVDDVVAKVLQLGRGTLLGKMDIRHAYRNIPISSSDRRLLGMV